VICLLERILETEIANERGTRMLTYVDMHYPPNIEAKRELHSTYTGIMGCSLDANAPMNESIQRLV
jgi:hypothetical protein